MTGHLFTHLTREEWKLCFALVFLEASDEFTESYPLAQFASPDSEGRSRDYIELFQRAIRYLALEHGYSFEGLRVYENGNVAPFSQVEPRNMAYRHLLASGDLPDLPLLLETAVEMARRHAPRLNLGPLRGMYAKVQGDLRQMEDWRKAADPEGEVDAELANLRDQGMRSLGLVPDDELKTH